jgi:chemotaxis protein MotA
MLLIVGLLVVIGSVLGGYLMAGGHVLLLNQPSEFIIIGGAAAGTLLISTPPSVLSKMVKQTLGLLKPGLTRDDFAELLTLQYQLFRVAQQTGVMALESHFENPEASPVLSKYPRFLARHESVAFLSDSMKVIIIGGMAPHDLEALMDEDLEVHHHTEKAPAGALSKVGDAMPGLGIVAAVLGIVITMQSIDGPPEEIGHHVGAALVGTFLGILMAYGFIGPIVAAIEQRLESDGRYEQCLKAGILATFKGLPPAVAVEFARRVLPHEVRPSFEETEKFCRATTRPDAANAA